MEDKNVSSASAVEDMTTLTTLTEQNILENLKIRYSQQYIYTYTGTILVALNPYKNLSIYDNAHIKRYQGALMNERPPHIFAIAETALSNVRNYRQNQAIIISGESGAGKTESTKVILQYLTTVTAAPGEEQSWIEQQILEANTILESFGNAKTVRNNNSSRFGKFIQVLFNGSFQIIGASIVSYLLEKSRVVRQANSERNYHVFYELLSGANSDERQRWKLRQKMSDYHYLDQSGCIDIPGVNDKKHFENLKLALQVLKISQTDFEGLMCSLSAILHLGNVQFEVPEGRDGAQVTQNDLETVKIISDLLKCNYDDILSALSFRKITVRNESTMVPLKIEQAYDNRDSMAKTIYDKLFNWIIEFINQSTKSKEAPKNFIGVLDIFGFELFEANSFEQLCINYTNEKLQQFFNQFIFKLEQEEYVREGISVESISYKDNQPCLDLIEGKTGILSLLDEECKMPKGTDETYLSKIHQTHEKNENYIKPRTTKGVFGIKHYAGDVPYSVVGFLDKNRDAIVDEIFEIFQSCDTPLLKKLFARDDSKDKTLKKAVTAGSNFKNQLTALVSILSSTTPHYVRCVKPNWEKKAFMFDDELVIAQLRYSGMLETIKIRKSGFPMRFPYENFNLHFKYLIGGVPPNSSEKAIAINILRNSKVGNSFYQNGNTKIFMKQQAYDRIFEENSKIRNKFVLIVQKTARRWLYQKRYQLLRKNTVFLQKYIKEFVARKKYGKMKKAAVVIQCAIRGWFARDYLKQLKAAKLEEDEAKKKKQEMQEKVAKEEKLRKEAQEAGLPSPEMTGPSAEEIEADKIFKEEADKKAEEERKLANYAAKINKASKETAAPDLDNLFSFLGDFDENSESKVENNAVSVMLKEEFDDIFKLDELEITPKKAPEPKIPSALPPPPPSSNIASLPPPPSFGSLPQKLPPPPLINNGFGGVLPSLPVTLNSLPLPPPPPMTGSLLPPPPSNSLQVPQAGNSAATTGLSPPAPRLKSNPLARKGGASFDEGVDSKNQWSLRAYAEKNFENHPKSSGTTFTLKKSVKESIPIDEMLCYSKNPISCSMIKLPKDSSKLVDLAIESFKNLLKLLENGSKKLDEMLAIALKLLETGMQIPELRDELFVQVCKQVTAPPSLPKGWDDIISVGWHLISLYSGSFPPSKHFSKHLLCFLNSVVASPPNEEVYKSAVYCEASVKKVLLHGPRKILPSIMEIQSVKTQQPILCRFYLMDGQVKACPVSSVTTAFDIVNDVSSRIDLKDPSGWSIFEIQEDPWTEHVIRSTEYISDILAFWEKSSVNSVQGTGYETVKKRGRKNTVTAKTAIGAGETKLYIKKRVFKNSHEIPVDPIELNLVYAQCANDVATDVYPMNEKTALQFAALKAQVDWGDVDLQSLQRFENLERYIPASMIKTQDNEVWIRGIIDLQQKLRGKHAMQARLLYLEALKQFKHFGCTLFEVKFKGFWQHPENVVLAIGSYEVLFMLKNKSVIEHISYKNIYNWDFDKDKITIIVRRSSDGKDSLNFDTEEIFAFQTKQTEEIATLLKEYSPKTGIDNRKKEISEFATDPELEYCEKDLAKAKASVIRKKLIKIPQSVIMTAASLDPGLKDVTLQEATFTEAESLKFAVFWNDIMLQTPGVLLDMTGQSNDVLQIASTLYPTLWEYAGSEKPAAVVEKGGLQADALVVLGLIRKSFGNPRIIDELYLQLTKIMGQLLHDTRSIMRLWRLSAVLSGSVRPQAAEILEYYKAFLKKHSLVNGKATEQNQMKEESKYAKFCYRVLQRCQLSDPRTFSPSMDEILAAMSLSALVVRFFLPDGQTRAVHVDATTTVGEFLNLMKGKLNLNEALGFAAYEKTGSNERNLSSKEKVCDLLAKWDAMKVGEKPKFVLKKRLFFHPFQISQNELEEDFLLFQALDDILAGKYPLSAQESLYLAGLRLQTQHGDASSSNEIDYDKQVQLLIPEEHRITVTSSELKREHLSLRGKNAIDCKKLFMQTIRMWDLYGSTVFDVSQTYSSELPENCWLLVNREGVHVSAPKNKQPFASHPIRTLGPIIPDEESIMIVTEGADIGGKYVFKTTNAFEIADLIREYQEGLGSLKEANLGSLIELRRKSTRA